MLYNKESGMFIKLVATYVGAVIGAGFASGQEILQFFILFGYQGLIGVAVATILFAYLGSLVLYLSVKLAASSYQELFTYLLGPWAGKFMDKISLLMLAGGLGIMMSGSGAVLQEYYDLPAWVGIALTTIVIIFVILNGLKGLLTINVILVPLKLMAVFLIAVLAISYHDPKTEIPFINQQGVSGNWFLASILYVSFNMIVPVAVLASMGRTITKKTGIYAGLIGGVCLGVAVFMVAMAGLTFYPNIVNYEVPMLYMASCVSSLLRPIFALLIWLAILTTAVANAHGFASRLAPEGGKRYQLYGIGVCFLVLPLTYFDFSFLVRMLYPLFGYAGLVLFIALLIRPLINIKGIIFRN